MSHPASSQRSNLVPIAMLAVSMASVQVGAAIAKGMFSSVGPLGAVALRVSFSAVLLTAVFRPWRVRRSIEAWRWILVYGIAVGGMNGLFYASLRTVPLGIATALEFTGPLAVAIFSSRRVVDFLWVALAVVGLLALFPLGSGAPHIDPKGAALALSAGVCWAMYIVFGRKAGGEHGLQTTAIGMAIAAILVLPAGVAEAGAALLSPNILPIAFVVAVLSSALPYTLEMYALPRLSPKTFGTLMSAEPAIGALAGLVLLGEQLAARQWLGVGAIIATSVGTTLSQVKIGEPVPQGTDPTVGDFASCAQPAFGSEWAPHLDDSTDIRTDKSRTPDAR